MKKLKKLKKLKPIKGCDPLFSLDNHPKPDEIVEVTIFCDERKPVPKQHPKEESWLYIGIVIIPTKQIETVLRNLDDIRDADDYYHELHFTSIRADYKRSNKTRVAVKWINLLKYSSNIYYNILGICKDNLTMDIFGEDSSQHGNMYNRFFRICVHSALKMHFKKYKRIVVTDVYHDNEGYLEEHDYFPWHLMFKVMDEKIKFACDGITFINSDHKKEFAHTNESHIIQLTDLIVGSTSECYDMLSNAYKSSNKKDGKRETVKTMLGLLLSIIKAPYSKRAKQYRVQFFPRRRLSKEELRKKSARARVNLFFKDRTIEFYEWLSNDEKSEVKKMLRQIDT